MNTSGSSTDSEAPFPIGELVMSRLVRLVGTLLGIPGNLVINVKLFWANEYRQKWFPRIVRSRRRVLVAVSKLSSRQAISSSLIDKTVQDLLADAKRVSDQEEVDSSATAPYQASAIGRVVLPDVDDFGTNS